MAAAPQSSHLDCMPPTVFSTLMELLNVPLWTLVVNALEWPDCQTCSEKDPSFRHCKWQLCKTCPGIHLPFSPSLRRMKNVLKPLLLLHVGRSAKFAMQSQIVESIQTPRVVAACMPAVTSSSLVHMAQGHCLHRKILHRVTCRACTTANSVAAIFVQFLESYKSVTLQSMADSFGVSIDFMDKELSDFIVAGRLPAKIDKVAGIIETTRCDSRCLSNQHH